MKKVISCLVVVLSLCVFNVPAQASYYGGSGYVHVNGYTKSNGTYVQSHYRTRPDGIKSNNLSYRF
ncbi:MAG: hypothetical protein J6R52_04840 [Alphaproteobacteria bacterium]|nr:hypothetical protein [Alphaproteobacteria bacterium]